ncbi:DHH family phosphoesterase [Mesomycoplasma neurolyticum]|uniref:Bifunctional oligoribonuclease and PAP phosphatase nrnA n=1 Tax=Mesomycoplasma neurolyticum TaxID=2120 RepID=A0A449A5W2_9BACT|nr:bifunctional oligoribonuclease/PAP phosphatase NrnA [Mesomycoplasma neurolyticum]VEU59628.1 Bifunctional oligoribonuclease and PAP phosphatase nrnA [Mesomycoplasma neurolyticum]
MKKGSIQQVTEEILNHNNIVIFHHIRPDGDCLGAQFGLKELIQNNFPDKKVLAIGDKQNLFTFLDIEHDKIPNDDFLKNALAIIVDANFKDRIENRYLLDENKFKTVIRIDHHPNDDDLNAKSLWVDSSYVACCEQIAHLAFRNKWKVTPKAAEYIYLGIYTDSGRFLFNNTSHRTLLLTSKLWKTKADVNKIHSNITRSSLNDIRFNAYIQSNFKSLDNVVYYVLDLKKQKEFDKTPNQATRPNLLANIENFNIWLSFVQEEKNKWRVESRSNGPIVRDVAVKWGGGGHANASGAIINSKKKIELIVKDCQEVVNAWKLKNK